MEDRLFDNIAIMGLGLLGGSLARAGRKAGLFSSVTGFGRNDARLAWALENGIADKVTKDPLEAVSGAGIVVLCTPVNMIIDMMGAIAPALAPGTIVTDVGSTKQTIVDAASGIFPHDIHFVGAHPMAGSENSGVESSFDTLYENAICVVTPTDTTDMASLSKVTSMWQRLKASVMVMPPDEHDYLVAVSSHLAHFAAVGVVNCVEDICAADEKVLSLLAGGFRDTTRVASGSPEVWRDICAANAAHIASILSRYSLHIADLASLIASGNFDELENVFDRAKIFRDGIPARKKGLLTSDYELIVDVADRPGVIGDIATALGAARINIRNISVQHVRELKGGALSILVENDADLAKAVDIIKSMGMSARPVQ